MEDTKSLFKSKTVLGIVAVIIGSILPPLATYFGFTFTTDDGANLVDLIGKNIEGLGALLALYGRIKATKKIG